MANTPPPLMDGPLRDQAIARVHEIAEALARPYEEWTLSQRPGSTGLRSVSLALGRGGPAVFYAWLARNGLYDRAHELAARYIQESMDLFGEQSMDASLLCGFPSVAWTVEHVLRLLDQFPADDPNEPVDEAIVAALADDSYVPAYDLIDGLAGLGVYALERYPHSRHALPMMEGILRRLEFTACKQSIGVAWPSGQMTRTAQGKDVAADETYFNLGLSHGIPGVIGCLARFQRVPEVRDRAAQLLGGAVEWFQEQRLPPEPDAQGAYPDFVAHDVESEPARLAWCYGDPGVALALFAAARARTDSRLEAFALDVAHSGARRPLASSGVVDAGLCHGSAGLAHIFHRLYRASGDEVCRQASVQWLTHLLERVEDRPNIAGMTTFCFERERDGEYIEDPAWLTGAAGAGLVLVSALSEPNDKLPTWDRPLLADLDG